MRTSGADQDTVLFAIPVVVFLIVAVYQLGGIEHTVRLTNDTVVGALQWLGRLL